MTTHFITVHLILCFITKKNKNVEKKPDVECHNDGQTMTTFKFLCELPLYCYMLYVIAICNGQNHQLHRQM